MPTLITNAFCKPEILEIPDNPVMLWCGHIIKVWDHKTCLS